MKMLQLLIEWDKQITVLLHPIGHPYLDNLMYLLSEPLSWIPLFLLWSYWIIQKFGWKAWLLVLLSTIVFVGISDFISSHIFKPFFKRLRPCKDPTIKDQILLVNHYCASLYGFVSSHASNSATIATSFYRLFPKVPYLWGSAFLWTVLFSYTRLYLGVHFVGDLLGGILLGLLIGYLNSYFVKKFSSIWLSNQNPYNFAFKK